METPAKSPPTPPAIALGREGGEEGLWEEGAAGAARPQLPRGLRGGNAVTVDPRAGQSLPQGQGPSSGRGKIGEQGDGRGPSPPRDPGSVQRWPGPRQDPRQGIRGAFSPYTHPAGSHPHTHSPPESHTDPIHGAEEDPCTYAYTFTAIHTHSEPHAPI